MRSNDRALAQVTGLVAGLPAAANGRVHVGDKLVSLQVEKC